MTGYMEVRALDARLYGDVINFTECIKDTPEYREYQEKKKKIEGFPELKERAEILKQNTYELCLGFDPERDPVSKMMKYSDENEDIFMEPVINEYLTAEAAFCRMMREILDMTMDRIDF